MYKAHVVLNDKGFFFSFTERKMLIWVKTVYLDVLFLKHFKSFPFSCSTLAFSRHVYN